MNPNLKMALEKALQAATSAGDMGTVHTLAGILKKSPADDSAPQEMAAVPETVPPEVEPQEATAPEALTTLLVALYPDNTLEDYQANEDGTGFAVVEVADGDIMKYWKVPFTTLEDGMYSLGTPEEVQPEPAPEMTKAKSTRVRAKSADVTELAGDEPPKEFRIWAYGLIRTTKGDAVLTRENADVIVKDWADRGTDLHFDYEHGTFSDSAAAGNPAPAAGWFKLEARDDGLYAVGIKWTDKAAQLIRDKEYRYTSPAYAVDTSTNQIVGFENMAITNLPATKGIEALVKAKTELEATTAKQKLEIDQLRREAHKTRVQASIKELEQAGVPTAVITRARPLLELVDAPTLTLTRNGKTEQTTAANVLHGVLLEMAKLGSVPMDERTKQTLDTSHMTQDDAVKIIRARLEKEGKTNVRTTDVLLMARKEYPHLKGVNA